MNKSEQKTILNITTVLIFKHDQSQKNCMNSVTKQIFKLSIASLYFSCEAQNE